jgi:hypothetical protein
LSKRCTIQSTAPKKKTLTFLGDHKGTQTKTVKLDEIEVVWNMAAKASKNCNVPQIQKMKKTPQNATFSKTQIRMKPKICCKTWNNIKTLGAMKKKKKK